MFARTWKLKAEKGIDLRGEIVKLLTLNKKGIMKNGDSTFENVYSSVFESEDFRQMW
jgi:hypothetical protein